MHTFVRDARGFAKRTVHVFSPVCSADDVPLIVQETYSHITTWSSQNESRPPKWSWATPFRDSTPVPSQVHWRQQFWGRLYQDRQRPESWPLDPRAPRFTPRDALISPGARGAGRRDASSTQGLGAGVGGVGEGAATWDRARQRRAGGSRR